MTTQTQNKTEQLTQEETKMKRTYVDMVCEYYDNLDSLIDMRASGMGPQI